MSLTKNPTASPYYNGNDDPGSYPSDGEKWDQVAIQRIIDDIDAIKKRLGTSASDSANAPFWGASATLADRILTIGASDELVKVSAGDTTAGRLEDKLAAGANVVLTKLMPGGNEQLEISVPTGTDELAKVSANDTTSGYLNGKLTAGAGIALSEQNDGANENLEIAVVGGGTTVGVSPADTTPDDLDSKISVGGNGSGTYKNILNPGGNEQLEIISPYYGSIHRMVCGRSTTEAVTIEPGRVLDRNGVYFMESNGTLVANITVSGAGGLFGATEANSTWYFIQVIGDSTGVNPVAAMLSPVENPGTLPAGYDLARRVGAVYNDAFGDLVEFVQIGNFEDRKVLFPDDGWTDRQILLNGNSTSWAAVSTDEWCPPNFRALLHAEMSGSQVLDLKTNLSDLVTEWSVEGLGGSSTNSFNVEMWTTATGDIRYRVNTGNNANIYAIGYLENLRPLVFP